MFGIMHKLSLTEILYITSDKTVLDDEFCKGWVFELFMKTEC